MIKYYLLGPKNLPWFKEGYPVLGEKGLGKTFYADTGLTLLDELFSVKKIGLIDKLLVKNSQGQEYTVLEFLSKLEKLRVMWNK